MSPATPVPVRVAMVIPSLRGGGLERIVRDLTLGLDRERFLVRVLTVGGLGVFAADLEAAGIEIVDCSERGFAIRGLPLRLIRALASFRPDVIHAHSGTWYPTSVARWLLRKPALMYTEHGRYPPEPRGRAIVERWCAARTDGLYAVSTETARYLQEFLGLRERPGVLPNGVDLTVHRPADPEARARLRAEWGVTDRDVVGIAVGRFVPVKNQAGIVRALARAGHAGGAPIRIVFVGTGELEPSVRSLAEELGVAARATFLGFRGDVAACLGAADFFVNASTTEGLPVSILEAMATGLPVVATRVGGVPDVLGDPPAGILVPSGDEEALASAVATMAEDGPLRASLSALALERAGTYSLDAFLKRHEALYLALSGGNAR